MLSQRAARLARMTAAVATALFAVGIGCSDDPVASDFPLYDDFDDPPAWGGSSKGDGDDGGKPNGGAHPGEPGFPCKPPRTRKPLPARDQVMAASARSGPIPIFTRDLFNSFQSHCGACHVDTSLGGFDGQVIDFENFPLLIDDETLAVVRSNDEEALMPPPVAGGKPYDERSQSDPIVQLVQLLQHWIEAGSPRDSFFLEPEDTEAESPYLLTQALGESLTNLGNCLPEAEFFAREKERSTALDGHFSKMKSFRDLPRSLRDTDLFTLDHATLAYHGVAAYEPTYPLWSDDAGKLRHVRVPVDESIEYDSQRNEFSIPENTRFYKTFLKEVVDETGRSAWRKIETRLIVTRSDECHSGGCEPRALFGTYAWNDDETEATLVEDPLRSGEPFRDRLVTYLTDEQRARQAGEDAQALSQLTRRYAIPGSERCVQCHLGSPNASFVLGFTPLQIKRQPYVSEPDMMARGADLVGHGVLEQHAPGKDELDQLERLLDLGIVTGLDDPAQLVGLRESQGRPPRNGYELRAQGYMLGNCAHCHNPRGFPTRENPELSRVLDMLPSPEGGIFGYPLERYSPRTRRGENAERLIPYITPSVFDLRGRNGLDWNKKEITVLTDDGSVVLNFIEAPWRSMIYRNVDAPFTYQDDYAVFPHMPRHAPGFDCEAPRILGDWMVSIPAHLKSPDVPEHERASEDQPYVEVDPEVASQQDYEDAVEAARDRLDAYHEGERYGYCPDTSDIQDPEVLSGQYQIPQDHGYFIEGQPAVPFRDNVPDRAHWVVSDFTSPPGDWSPRRSDWKDILLQEDQDKVAALHPDERKVIEKLTEWDIRLTDAIVEFATAERPYGVWENDDGRCDDLLADFPVAGELEPPPTWVLSPDFRGPFERVISRSPGEAVFSNICSKCHGRLADSHSSLANTLNEITGGSVRVADFRNGILGPRDAPGQNRARAFEKAAKELKITVDDLAARYAIWMALGGTKVTIPDFILRAVGNAPVMGQSRGYALAENASANMLTVAVDLCRETVHGSRRALDDGYSVRSQGYFDALLGTKYHFLLFDNTADGRVWEEICALNQAVPVRVLVGAEKIGNGERFENGATLKFVESEPKRYALLDPTDYGTRPVMTRDGVRDGVPVGTSNAWCFERSQDPEVAESDDAYLVGLIDGVDEASQIPYCPTDVQQWYHEDSEEFALRGAMNAGLVVFSYLDQLSRGQVESLVQYNECEKLEK